MGKGGGSNTTVTKSDPWSGQQPYLTDLYRGARELTGYYQPTYETKTRQVPITETIIDYNDPNPKTRGQGKQVTRYETVTDKIQTGEQYIPGTGKLEYFPGETVAGFTPEQTEAMGLISERARAGSPLLGASQGYAQDILEGKYLNPDTNPYLGYYTQRAFEDTLPQWDTSAISAGRYGSDTWALGKGRTMADIQSQIYGGAYEAERGRMGEAAQYAPMLAQADYYDPMQLYSVGAEQQAYNQSLIDAAREKWEYDQMEPWNRLAMYSNLLSGNVGGVASSTFT